MSPTLCQPLREHWELILDGVLPSEELGRYEEHLAECRACREFVQEDARLTAAIRATGFGDLRPRRRPAAPWFRRVAVAAAAVLLVGFGWFLGRIDGGGARDARPLTGRSLELAEAGPLIAPNEGIERSLPGGGRLLLAPGSHVELTLDERNEPIVRLESGSLAVDRTEAPAIVETNAGWVELEGRASVQTLAVPGGLPLALVTVTKGRARITSLDGETAEAVPGRPVLLEGDVPAPLADTLDRHRRLTTDEALVVMTSEEAMELTARHTAERTELERRVGELMETNQQLQLKLDAYAQRRGGRKMEPVSLDEMIRILGVRTDERAARLRSGGKGGRTGRIHRGGPSLWFVLRRQLRGREAEALPSIREHLLADGRSTARKLLGLRLLYRFRKVDVSDVVIPLASDDDRVLRKTALGVLARRRDPSLRPILENAFRDDASLAIRITAAGGLVALGDTGEPLARLQAWYRDPETSRRHRRYALTRILRAPLNEIADFIIEVARHDAELEESDLRAVVESLGELATPEALQALDDLVERVDDPRLVLLIRSTREFINRR